MLAQLDGSGSSASAAPRGARRWALHALNPAFAARPLPDLAAVRGVVIQIAPGSPARFQTTSGFACPYLYRIQPLGVLKKLDQFQALRRGVGAGQALRAADAPGTPGKVR